METVLANIYIFLQNYPTYFINITRYSTNIYIKQCSYISHELNEMQKNNTENFSHLKCILQSLLINI
jgi:hypothetical protein